jgi:uncharacterized protein YjiS (DUF1127 family)
MAQAHALKLGLLGLAVRTVSVRIGRAWAAYWSGRARRATVLMLQSLDGRTLKDIGIDRSEIESVIYGQPDDRRR